MKHPMVEVTGSSANIGRVRGKAVVLKRLPSPEEDIQISPGDILVVHNMTPDMIVRVIGIGGIVAEVGGITSHAATLSREFGIPCIVGVPNITELVPNGAFIEVNGDKGIVRFYSEATH